MASEAYCLHDCPSRMSCERRIALVDSLPVFLAGLSSLVVRAWPSAKIEARTSADGMDLQPGQFDLVVADVEALGGVEADSIQKVVAALSPTPVIALAQQVDSMTASRAAATGVAAYLPKAIGAEALLGVMAMALAGASCLHISAPPQAFVAARPAVSARSREILMRIERGRSNKMIARELGVSIATVKLQVQALLRETGARNRTEAVTNARRMGLI